MPRFEYKYNIPFGYLNSLRNDVLPYLIYDSFASKRPNKEYTVRSLYLDSHKLITYNEKLDGVKDRKKFRIRCYNEQNEYSKVFLEIKRKDVDHIMKDRAKVKYTSLEKFLYSGDMSLIESSGTSSSIKKDNARKFMYYFHYHILQPAVLVNYEREALECKFGSGLRVTFDKNVRAKKAVDYKNLFTDDGFKAALKDHFVLEVKFHRVLPNWMPRVLRKYNIIRESSPKYAMSVNTARDRNKLLIMK